MGKPLFLPFVCSFSNLASGGWGRGVGGGEIVVVMGTKQPVICNFPFDYPFTENRCFVDPYRTPHETTN